MDIWYGATQDIEWYDPDALTTANGTLNIRFDAFQSHNLNYRSGMLQSWNKLCFKGGRIEASISLPGRGTVSGFWPGFWAMGNLGRPGYTSTTEGLWPYSYWDKCDAGITANQSSVDGVSFLPGMKLPACTCKNENHPSPGNSRSAPEIDVIEAQVATLVKDDVNTFNGEVSQSFQVAPFDVNWQPDYNYAEVYDQQTTGMNAYTGGNFQQAFSAITQLNNDWYDGKAYQKYGFEYTFVQPALISVQCVTICYYLMSKKKRAWELFQFSTHLYLADPPIGMSRIPETIHRHHRLLVQPLPVGEPVWIQAWLE